MEYLTLFTSAFVSATLFPGGSEVILWMMANDPQYNIGMLIMVATIGNTLGGFSSWLIGYLLPSRYAEDPRHQQAIKHLRRWGRPALLLSWLPIIGDPLCLAAGWLRMPLLSALAFISIGKLLRYSVIVWLFI